MVTWLVVGKARVILVPSGANVDVVVQSLSRVQLFATP